MEALILYIIIPGRINLLQMGRYGKSCEQRFRQNFSKDFDWLEFNLSSSERTLTGDRKAIAIDPRYIFQIRKMYSLDWLLLVGYSRTGKKVVGNS